jgi:putative addiction module component (TIGR02574 family)
MPGEPGGGGAPGEPGGDGGAELWQGRVLWVYLQVLVTAIANQGPRGSLPMSDATLPAEVRNLPVAERFALVERIGDGIARAEADFELAAAQRAELDRRLAQRATPGSRGSARADAKRSIVEGS